MANTKNKPIDNPDELLGEYTNAAAPGDDLLDDEDEEYELSAELSEPAVGPHPMKCVDFEKTESQAGNSMFVLTMACLDFNDADGEPYTFKDRWSWNANARRLLIRRAAPFGLKAEEGANGKPVLRLKRSAFIGKIVIGVVEKRKYQGEDQLSVASYKPATTAILEKYAGNPDALG